MGIMITFKQNLPQKGPHSPSGTRVSSDGHVPRPCALPRSLVRSLGVLTSACAYARG